MSLKIKMPTQQHPACIFCHKVAAMTEHASAGAYALYETFHLTPLVLWTAWGLLTFGGLALLSNLLPKGA